MYKLLIVIFVFMSPFLVAQKILDIHYSGLIKKSKSFQLFNNSEFTYKLKGQASFKTHKLVNIQDSALLLDNDSVIYLNQIKSIRINGVVLSPLLFGAGTLFLLLDTFHNVVFDRPQIINNQALVVTSVFYVSGIIMRFAQYKYIRINHKTVLRTIDANYQNLNSK